MRITQTFHIGFEEASWEEFFLALPNDENLYAALVSVFDELLQALPYKKYFVLMVDTETKQAKVTEIV